jgi:hypothetical protein
MDVKKSKSIDAAMAKLTAITGITAEEISGFLRETVVVSFGDQAGVDLRDLSDDLFRMFERRFWELVIAGVDLRISSGDSLGDPNIAEENPNDAAWQAVHELFVVRDETPH